MCIKEKLWWLYKAFYGKIRHSKFVPACTQNAYIVRLKCTKKVSRSLSFIHKLLRICYDRSTIDKETLVPFGALCVLK